MTSKTISSDMLSSDMKSWYQAWPTTYRESNVTNGVGKDGDWIQKRIYARPRLVCRRVVFVCTYLVERISCPGGGRNGSHGFFHIVLEKGYDLSERI
jgi:hypothetical protein